MTMSILADQFRAVNQQRQFAPQSSQIFPHKVTNVTDTFIGSFYVVSVPLTSTKVSGSILIHSYHNKIAATPISANFTIKNDYPTKKAQKELALKSARPEVTLLKS